MPPELLDADGGRWFRTRVRDAVWEYDGGPGSVQLPYALLVQRFGPVTPRRVPAPSSRSLPWHRLRTPALLAAAALLVFAVCWWAVWMVDQVRL